MNANVFVCPFCNGPLVYTENGFHCAACAREYPIIDGIPDFFVSELDETSLEKDPAWRENLIWLDQQMADARDITYRLSVRDLKGMAFVLNDLAGAECENKDYPAAERDYRESLRIAKKVKYQEGIATFTGNLAELALYREQWAEAESLAREALALAEKVGR